MGQGVIFLWLVLTILCFLVYHKVFRVYYVGGVGKGLLKEVVVCGVGGLILTILSVKFWIVTDIILIILGLVAIKKCKSTSTKGLVIVGILIAMIAVTVIGNGYNQALDDRINDSNTDGNSNNFMTEREQEVAEEERIREEEERTAKEEYVAGHEIELYGDTPLDMFLENVDRYDIMQQLGNSDSMRSTTGGWVVETYDHASYDKFQGSLEVSYYEFHGVLQPSHERLHAAEWNCETEDDSSWSLAEELIYFFEEQYGEYQRSELGSDLTVYSWIPEDAFWLRVVVGMTDYYTFKVSCEFPEQYYTTEHINKYLADYENVFAYNAPELEQWSQYNVWSEEKQIEMTEEMLGTWEGRYLGNNGFIMEIVPLTGKLNADENYELDVSIYNASKEELFHQIVLAWDSEGEYFESLEDIQGNVCTTRLWIDRAPYGHQIIVTQELGVSAINLTGIYTREGMDPATVWQSSVDQTMEPMEGYDVLPVPEEGIELWLAEFGQYYDGFEYAYCDIDMDGIKDILIQRINGDEIAVDIYVLDWDPSAEEYYYFQAESVSRMGDWQWYAVEGEGLYAVVLYGGWQYIYQVTKFELYVEAELVSYGELRGNPTVYENPLSFMKY